MSRFSHEQRKKRVKRFMELVGEFGTALDSMPEEMKEEEKCLLENFKWTKKYCDETARVIEEGKKKIGVFQFTFIPEIFYAMDIWPFCGEALSVFLAILHEDEMKSYMDQAEEMGWPNHICSCLRGILAQEIEEVFPPADVIVSPSQPCDNGIITYQALQELSGAPHFAFDVPYWESGERVMEYLTNEVKRLVRFLEEETGNRLDLDKLKEMVKASNEANEYRLEIMETRRHVPCPQKSRVLAQVYMLGLCISGHPDYITYCKNILDDAQERIAKGLGAVPDEKLRLICFYFPIWWEFRGGGLLDWMETNYGAVTVQDLEGYHTINSIDPTNEETIFRGLAERIVNMPMGRQFKGSLDGYVNDVIRIRNDYKADALIIPAHVGCKHVWGSYGLMKEIFIKENLPMVFVPVDIFDDRVAPAEELKHKLGDFFSAILGVEKIKNRRNGE